MRSAFLVGLLLACSPIIGVAEERRDNHILYLTKQGRFAEAVDLYYSATKTAGHADYELLQQFGLAILEQGFHSSDEQSQIMALFGAGIAAHESATGLLAEGMLSPDPRMQMVSLDLLSKMGSDQADALIIRAAASEQLLIRLSALRYLAEKRHPCAIGQIEALYYKVVPELRPIFPRFYSLSGDPRASKQLRRLLHDPSEDVRLETILAIGEQGRDDLLPQIRTVASHPNAREQEASAAVLGVMGDQSSIPRLKVLADSKVPEVRLAAYRALYQLGDHAVRTKVEEIAGSGNVFAITLLGQMEGSEGRLVGLMKSNNLQVRCNATLALLERRDPRCLTYLPEILVRDVRDIAFRGIISRGGALKAWKVIPSAAHNLAETPEVLELSTALRMQALTAAFKLPEDCIFKVAEVIFDSQQNDLVPPLIELLETVASTKVVDLLKSHQQKIGAPLVRNYCALALLKMGEPGPYAEVLQQWVAEQMNTEMIQFRPSAPVDLREHHYGFGITPQETSQLFIAAVEAFANQRDEGGLKVLLTLIRDGNPQNRYALAGLLIRAAQ